MSGRQRDWLWSNVVLKLRVQGSDVNSRPHLFRFSTHKPLNPEGPRVHRQPSILTLYYFSSLILDLTQMTSRQLSDFFEGSFHWAPCLPCRTASLLYQSWRQTSLTTALTEVKLQSLQTWKTLSDYWVKEWHFMKWRWLSGTTRTYLVEGGGLTRKVSLYFITI